MIARAVVLLALLVGASGCDGCSCGGKKKAPETAQPARETPTAPVRKPPREMPAVKPGTVKLNAPLDPEEAKDALPALPGAALGEPQVPPGGGQVRLFYCIGGGNLNQASQRVEQALTGAGWQHAVTQASADGTGISAERDDLRITVRLETTTRPDCDGAHGKFYATILMNRTADTTTPPAP